MVGAEVLEEVRLGSERQNAKACALKLGGGVDGGDGKRLRGRSCGAVWESAGPVFCEILRLPSERETAVENAQGSCC